jgi:large subunit ribosomal protein L6
MSRIGKKIIEIPAGVTITVGEGNNIIVKGPKGEIAQQIDPEFKLKIEDNTAVLERPSESKSHKALHGLYRSLIHNNVVGVSQGHILKQELVGVGYRAAATGQILDMTLGYSHKIVFEIPKEVKVSTETLKGGNPTITLECNDKQLLGQVASKIRSLRKPEPYKGKGIRFKGEILRRKAGKSA